MDGEAGNLEGAQAFADPKWKYLNNILSQPGPFTDPEWPAYAMLSTAKVLVIGAGGLGCEILKNLALSGFKDIHVIDMDTIDVSNLNRQFLFRAADVGQPKADVAARFVQNRCPDVQITPYCGKIQDKDEDYYSQFQLIICGLDSIETRRWINKMLIDMVTDHPEDPQTWLKPLVDGGTEGFKGQARVVYPTMTSCIECQLDMHAPRAQVPLCTIATIPRQPQHCIEWAHQIAWNEERKDDTLDADDPTHIQWLYTRAQSRANEFNIPGVTYSMTQGVIKNIIPAIASTNAVIAAACTNEAFKILTGATASLGFPGTENYCMYTGDEGVYTYVFEHQRKEDCPVCRPPVRLECDGCWTLQQLLDRIKVIGPGTVPSPEEDGEEDEGDVDDAMDLSGAGFKNPTLTTGSRSLFYPEPESLYEATRPNLKRKLTDLQIGDGEEVAVSDPGYSNQFKFRLSFRGPKKVDAEDSE
ncbi:MAG: hypothetical protein M1831_007580 [Alyxoria varia]|nr:MAG: hypothetical protein M1831_007580 [Alyxoria varia]